MRQIKEFRCLHRKSYNLWLEVCARSREKLDWSNVKIILFGNLVYRKLFAYNPHQSTWRGSSQRDMVWIQIIEQAINYFVISYISTFHSFLFVCEIKENHSCILVQYEPLMKFIDQAWPMYSKWAPLKSSENPIYPNWKTTCHAKHTKTSTKLQMYC